MASEPTDQPDPLAPPVDLAALRAEHHEFAGVCGYCDGHPWPCPTIRLAAAYEQAARAVEAVVEFDLPDFAWATPTLASLDAQIKRGDG